MTVRSMSPSATHAIPRVMTVRRTDERRRRVSHEPDPLQSQPKQQQPHVQRRRQQQQQQQQQPEHRERNVLETVAFPTASNVQAWEERQLSRELQLVLLPPVVAESQSVPTSSTHASSSPSDMANQMKQHVKTVSSKASQSLGSSNGRGNKPASGSKAKSLTMKNNQSTPSDTPKPHVGRPNTSNVHLDNGQIVDGNNGDTNNHGKNNLSVMATIPSSPRMNSPSPHEVDFFQEENLVQDSTHTTITTTLSTAQRATDLSTVPPSTDQTLEDMMTDFDKESFGKLTTTTTNNTQDTSLDGEEWTNRNNRTAPFVDPTRTSNKPKDMSGIPNNPSSLIYYKCNPNATTVELMQCRIALWAHNHTALSVILITMLLGLCWYWRCCCRCAYCCSAIFAPGDQRGDYRTVAAQFGNVHDDAFMDNVSDDDGGDDGYRDGVVEEYDDDDDDGWSNIGKRSIEMKSLEHEVNGGLTLEEMNG